MDGLGTVPLCAHTSDAAQVPRAWTLSTERRVRTTCGSPSRDVSEREGIGR